MRSLTWQGKDSRARSRVFTPTKGVAEGHRTVDSGKQNECLCSFLKKKIKL